MYFEILIFCIGFHVIPTQIINHHYTPTQDEDESLRWPNLNIVMHVPSENGSLKRVPIYQDPSTIRRNQAVQREYQRKMGGRYYSNHKNNTYVPPPPPETEWAMGRPPGVRFQRLPGIDYQNFQPGPTFDESPGVNRNNSIAVPASRFSANRRNKNLTMALDVAMHPPPEEMILENISKDNDSTILYNFTDPNQNNGHRNVQRRYRNRSSNNRKMFSTNVRNTRPKSEPLIEEYSGNISDLKRLLNDSIHVVNNNNNINMNRRSNNNWNQYRGYQPPPTNNFNPAYDTQYYDRPRIEQEYQPRFRGIRNRYFQSYQPTQRREPPRTEPDNERYYFSGLNPSLDPQENQSFNYSFGAGENSTPIFWDGSSPMNISITQRDPHNNTIFSYSFDPNRLIQHNITNKNDILTQRQNFFRPGNSFQPRNRVKEAKEASKIWKSISKYNDTDNQQAKIPMDQGNLFYGHPAPEENPQLSESSELLGFFPKHSSNIFELPKYEQPQPEVNKFRRFYSALADEVIPENKDMILTGIDQDSSGNYVYQPLESNDRKQSLSPNNMILVTPAPYNPNGEEIETNKYILMQLKKPKGGQSNIQSDFKSKVEPLIITSIYRQFLTDIKKNVSHNGLTKHKLHFSFKLGPGYFNKELVQPKKFREEHFNFDDEKYDSRQYFHDKKR